MSSTFSHLPPPHLSLYSLFPAASPPSSSMSRLPPPSLSVKLPIMEKPPSSELTPTRLGFPNEFPYEFDSPAFSPGFTSPGDSTETEDESSDDEEDFLAGLTRRLAPSTQRLPLNSINTKNEEKIQVTSPQSTLSRLGSFSNSESHSPNFSSTQAPMTSFRRDNAWDVISAAAGEVARLKLGSYEPRQNPDLLLRRQNAAFQADHSAQQQRLYDQVWLCSQSRVKSSENLRYMRHNAVSNVTWLPHHAGTPLKRPSVGTGVFLPRRYPTATPSGKVNTTAMLQSKVSQTNLNFNEFTTGGPIRSQLDYECMLASTLVARQGSFRSVGGCCLNQERPLPQDWM